MQTVGTEILSQTPDPTPREAPAANDAATASCEIRPGMTIADCERLLIQQTLAHGTSNRERAARMLGISRRALQYKLKEYGLIAPRGHA